MYFKCISHFLVKALVTVLLIDRWKSVLGWNFYWNRWLITVTTTSLCENEIVICMGISRINDNNECKNYPFLAKYIQLSLKQSVLAKN